MIRSTSIPRIFQQQQPQRMQDRQQQQSSGSGDFQPGGGQRAQQMGEGSYEGTRDYQKSVKTYLSKHDPKADAKAAKPASAEEARELQDAEQEGLSHSKAKGE